MKIRHIVLFFCVLHITWVMSLDPDYSSRSGETTIHAKRYASTETNIRGTQNEPNKNLHQLTAERKTGTTPAGWSSCPRSCSCDFNTRTATCDAYGHIPADLPTTFIHLNMSKCMVDVPHRGEFYLAKENSSTESAVLGLVAFQNKTELDENISVTSHGLATYGHLQSLDLSCNSLTDLNAFNLPANLSHLYLNSNAIRRLNLLYLLSVLPHLELLDLSGNRLQELAATSRNEGNLTKFYSKSNLQDNSTMVEKRYDSVLTLELSGNQINRIDSNFLARFPSLSHLDLSNNKIAILPRDLFSNCSKLTYLSLSENRISNLPSHSFKGLSNLRELYLTDLQLIALHRQTFAGLSKLKILNLSHNTRLEIIHADTFSHLSSLRSLDLSHGSLQTIHEGTFDGLQCEIKLTGNPWRCDCNLNWLLLGSNTTFATDNLTCLTPFHLRGYPFFNISINDSCFGAFITYVTHSAFFKFGFSAKLDCVAEGDPVPNVTWVTPHNRVFHHHPAYVDHEISELYNDYQLQRNRVNYKRQNAQWERLHLLPNGSLFLDYVTRSDTGAYRCIVGNQYGNDTAVVQFTLDYTGLFSTVLWTEIVGICAAAAFLVFGVVLGIVRNIMSWCKIKHQEDTNRKFKNMLHSISDYKTAQIDRLSAYKAAKMGQLSAFKNSKMDKFHSFSRPSLGSALHHMHSMREHYSAQIDVIKENCAQRAERLRENYTLRLQRFRDYKSDKVGKLRGYKAEKIEHLRDNYTHQAQKIREYGSQQMAKLRRSYKLQQHYLLKLYELLDIGNCMTVIEAECMRTESMLFDENFMNLDLEAHPVHIHINLSESEDDADSYYVTASSQSDISVDVSVKGGVIKDDSFGESVSDYLDQEELNFDDLEIQPYPPYLNFLEAIELETKKDRKGGSALKQRKQKKSKKISKESKEKKSSPQRQSPRKSNQKSVHRRAKTKPKISQGTDTDSENEPTVLKSENEKKPQRNLKPRAKNSQRPENLDLQKRVIQMEQIQDDNLLSPTTLRMDALRKDDDAQSSVYESAHASREPTPKLTEKSYILCYQTDSQTSMQCQNPGSNDLAQGGNLHDLSDPSCDGTKCFYSAGENNRNSVERPHGSNDQQLGQCLEGEAMVVTENLESKIDNHENKASKVSRRETIV